MSDSLFVTLRRRPIPDGTFHYMFVDHRDRAGFIPADALPNTLIETIVAEITPVASHPWPRWTATALLPFHPNAV